MFLMALNQKTSLKHISRAPFFEISCDQRLYLLITSKITCVFLNHVTAGE